MNRIIAPAILTLGIVISGCAAYGPNGSAAPTASGWYDQEAELEREYEECLASKTEDCSDEHHDLHQHIQWEMLERSS